ncbi:fumarylacetoacetate hydrolase family protein [Yoonia sp. SS1-5]|uniref:Fumarylacetoacetate hydrolase family protein n=1 Tax=Yoonia rhodophyticola TaxID=3137370 RepID=A0AAN0NH97_9RHOB
MPVLPVKGQGTFPVRRIYCVGRNYAAHAAEMGDEVDREVPFYFTKSAHALLQSGQDMPYAPRTTDLHHEIELVVAIGTQTENVAKEEAIDAVFGLACGLDMTRRDLQAAAKEQGRPWDTAKDFDNAAIIGPITPIADAGIWGGLPIQLRVNDMVVQDARLSDMVWSVREIIADLSTLYTLQAGDLIMMGTPAGVGSVNPGDQLVGSIGALDPVMTKIV